MKKFARKKKRKRAKVLKDFEKKLKEEEEGAENSSKTKVDK